jgi:PAS domain S-box-containing protein
MFYNDQNKPAKVVGVIQDITSVVEINRRIKILADILDISPVSVLVHYFDGTIIYANQRSFEMHGYSREEFMALTLQQLDVPECKELISERIRMLRDVGEASFNVEHFHKDGSRFPMRVNAKITQWNDREVIISVGTDTR